MPPPTVPAMPKMDGLQFWMTAVQPAIASSSSDDDECYAQSQIRRARTSCLPLQEKLEESRRVWQRAKRDAEQYTDDNSVGEVEQQDVAHDLNAKRDRVNAAVWNHKLCLANALCPQQCQLYGGCWKYAQQALGNDTVAHMWENRTLKRVCQPERDLIQRCLGRYVARAVDEETSKKSSSAFYSSSSSGSNFLEDMDDGDDFGF